MIQSLARITSECCHAPDAVNVNIANSESVPVFSWLIRWQPSRCPPTLDILDILDTQPHLLSPVYPAHTSSPALNLNTQQPGHWTHVDTGPSHCSQTPVGESTAAIIQYQASDIAKSVGAEDTFCVARVQYKCGVGAGTSDICHWSPDTPTHCIHHCQGTSGPGPWGWGH